MPKKETKTVNVNFSVEPSFSARLLAQAEKEGRTLSNLIRLVLKNYLEEQEREKSKKK
jgi:hypothetical protein